MKPNLCPCGSTHLYAECCEKFHRGELPENALELMRSRYSAYALALPDYIIKTTHPDGPTFQSNQKLWRKQILQFSQQTRFQRLEILNFTDGLQEAFVTFVAHLQQGGKDATFTEISRFQKVEGQWLYRDGKIFSGRVVI